MAIIAESANLQCPEGNGVGGLGIVDITASNIVEWQYDPTYVESNC